MKAGLHTTALAAAGLVCMAAPAHASLSLTNFLKWAETCKKSDARQPESCGYAQLYLLGSIEGVFAAEKKGKPPGFNPALCRFPNDVDGKQIFTEFLEYAEVKKSEWDPSWPAARYIFDYLSNKRPCPETQN